MQVLCDICSCVYDTTPDLASAKTCSLCEKYPFAEDRFAPIVLLRKVLESGLINSLSRFELSELHISRIFDKNPELCDIEIFYRLAYYLTTLFEDEASN